MGDNALIECTKCKQMLPLENFVTSTRHFSHYCGKCASDLSMDWQRRHPERRRQIQNAYYQRKRAKTLAAEAAKYIDVVEEATGEYGQKVTRVLQGGPTSCVAGLMEYPVPFGRIKCKCKFSSSGWWLASERG